jgi:hypothetical protein
MYQEGLIMYMQDLEEIYKQEYLYVLPIHMEMFFADMFGYVETQDMEILRLGFAEKKNLKFTRISRYLNTPHYDKSEFLNVVSYEDTMRMMRSSLWSGRRDSGNSINTSMIVGKILPIGICYKGKDANN